MTEKERLENRLALITAAIIAQAEDPSLWCLDVSIGEAYMQQSLRWLHRVIEDHDPEAFSEIVKQAKDIHNE